jgi:hypothetical protein
LPLVGSILTVSDREGENALAMAGAPEGFRNLDQLPHAALMATCMLLGRWQRFPGSRAVRKKKEKG